MLQRLSIALVLVKPGNTSYNLLNEICLTIFSLFRAKEIANKVYNNIMHSIKFKTELILFMYCENIKTSDSYSLLLHVSDKKRGLKEKW